MSETVTPDRPPSGGKDKTDGQVALEKLLALRDRLAIVDGRFKAVLKSVGGAQGAAPGMGAAASGRDEEQFFPALATLTAEIERQAVSLEETAGELEKRF